MTSFRITTYNIHKCRGLDRRVRPQRIIDVIKETRADVVALQEVVGMDEPERERNQVRAIAEELGFEFRIGENRRLHGGAYGNALLTKLPIIAECNHDITWRRREPRGCLEVVVSVGREHRVRIFNVHLGTAFFERRYQAKRLLEVVDEQAPFKSPRVVLGDFNEWPRGLASHLLENHFHTAEPQGRLGRVRSYPGILPLAHVDHVYYDSPLELVDVKIHRSAIALMASDHLPVVAEFRV
jgi:endonuclease/exonuclease/phosphatase family metal-dependent hydrolase